MSRLKELIKSFPRVPKVVVFDIDCTLWPFHIDSLGTRPFTPNGPGRAVDANGTRMDPYEDVVEIFAELKEAGIKIAAASRTYDPEASEALLTALGLYNLFHSRQIYPGIKTTHFEKIKEDCGVGYEEMLFFDDFISNIEDVSPLGVTGFFISDDDGISWSKLMKGFEQFNSRT